MTLSILNHFRCCLLCNRLGVNARSNFLCETCEECLLKKEIIIERKENWPVISLLSWQPDTEGVGRLIHALKTGSRRRFNFFSKVLSRQVLTKIEMYRVQNGLYDQNKIFNPVFIPAPPREVGKEDHADLFAQELVKQCGGLVRRCLKRVSSEEQKGLSLEDRQKNRLILHDQEWASSDRKSPKNDPKTLIFFIDDIIVSGSTAQAAFEALKKPKYFTVLTLATRPRLQKLAKIVINSDA